MDQNETFVPGRNYSKSETKNDSFLNETSFSHYVNNDVTKETTPIVGFMYSISREGVGEYWPIKLGRNTIGRSESCNINLPEASVSDLHASLNVKIMKSTGRLVASIRDEGSKTGLFLNDQELDYENYSCKNLDVLVVGTSYRLLLILIDAPEYGLTVAKNFIPADNNVVKKTKKTESINIDPFTRPAKINVNETIDIERPNNVAMERTRPLNTFEE